MERFARLQPRKVYEQVMDRFREVSATQEDYRFHISVARASGNPVLISRVDLVLGLVSGVLPSAGNWPQPGCSHDH